MHAKYLILSRIPLYVFDYSKFIFTSCKKAIESEWDKGFDIRVAKNRNDLTWPDLRWPKIGTGQGFDIEKGRNVT